MLPSSTFRSLGAAAEGRAVRQGSCPYLHPFCLGEATQL